jgi:hypothetical protein
LRRGRSQQRERGSAALEPGCRHRVFSSGG